MNAPPARDAGQNEVTRAVRAARRNERPAIARCLGRAFEDDPVASHLFPETQTRANRITSFYRAVIAEMTRHGRLDTEPGLRGAALWQAPAPPTAGPLRAFVSGIRMIAVMREALPRAQELGAQLQRAHPEDPHWYLAILGTEPEHQGKGIGSALLAPTLRECDVRREPAYLESSKPENVPFYERHGFRVTQEIEVPGGPKLWAMWRDPR